MHQSTTYEAWMVISAVVGAVATAALLVAGIGMLQLKPWSRKVSIAYAIYSLVMTPIGIVMQFLFMLPVLIEHAHQQPGPAASAAVNGSIGNMFGSLVGLIYPVLLLIFMTRRNVIAAFEPAAQSASQPLES
jgi:hypothetical protein